MSHKGKFIIGIDEVGRGPIAGPVAVGAFVFLGAGAKRLFYGAKESKQLNEKKREYWFARISDAKKNGLVDYAVAFQSRRTIDRKGISQAIRVALSKSLGEIIKRNKIKSENARILLDGSLVAPTDYKYQKTIIKGDEREMAIALASICAKVLRDRKMIELAKKYPKYGFERHKGYGTMEHYRAIRRWGVSGEHRRSFLRTLF